MPEFAAPGAPAARNVLVVPAVWAVGNSIAQPWRAVARPRPCRAPTVGGRPPRAGARAEDWGCQH
eukprot:2039774-Lingulodinium_polyedra.AAC.1